MVEQMWLIWSNLYHAWLEPDGRGYTQQVDEAGRFEEQAAQAIVAEATLGGLIRESRPGEPPTVVDQALMLPASQFLSGGES